MITWHSVKLVFYIYNFAEELFAWNKDMIRLTSFFCGWMYPHVELATIVEECASYSQDLFSQHISDKSSCIIDSGIFVWTYEIENGIFFILFFFVGSNDSI